MAEEEDGRGGGKATMHARITDGTCTHMPAAHLCPTSCTLMRERRTRSSSTVCMGWLAITGASVSCSVALLDALLLCWSMHVAVCMHACADLWAVL